MNIQVTIRHDQGSQQLRETVTAELERISRYADRITSCRAVIDSEHVDKTVEIVVNVSHGTFSAKAREDNIGKALDAAIEKIITQLKKLNKKRKDHKAVKGYVPPETAEEIE